MKHNKINISGSFFLILFLCFFASTTFFDHTHLHDGNIIVHSHPFKSDPNGKPVHTHNDSGFLLVCILDNIISEAIIFYFLISAILPLLREIFTSPHIILPALNNLSPYLLRGPPARISA
ncbi:MAG TPA: hypothetical protein PKX27_06960 [Bacteroidales bacterium]|nr:hypothetical protein [Bacteroidales bacterium]HOX73988.1 hypothetical protein [Bacteroidales bacterium]HPM87703.1 hypothetical protein [Bacteroidales bacterium]HQM69978.1 hypothetical protein [Bacteroidales bacterium]